VTGPGGSGRLPHLGGRVGPAARLARVTGMEEVRAICDRLAPLEPAVAEDRLLVELAEQRLAGVEAALVTKVEAALRATDEEEGSG
jgi:hypothetical protein